MGIISKYLIELFPKRTVMDSYAFPTDKEQEMSQNHSLFELKLTPVLLLPGADSTFPKNQAVTSRPRSVAERWLNLLFRTHSEDFKPL